MMEATTPPKRTEPPQKTSAAGPAAAEVRCVTKRYAENDPPAVEGLSLTAHPGEVLALLGPSGSGKTTVLRLLAGFLAPDSGTVSLGGSTVAGGDRFVPPQKRGLGVVFQDYALFPHLTVRENVAFGLNRRERKARARLVEQALHLVSMERYGHRYPHELSGGQQQRVALARALAPDPVFLLLDEPFSSLDAGLRGALREELADILHTSGTGALLVTHDQDDALYLGNRVAVMNEGRCEQVGAPGELYLRPRSRFVAGFMGRADFLPGEIIAGGVMTELGYLDQRTNLAEGSPVEVVFRPDDLDIEADPASAARVTHRHFEGTSFLYHVTLPSGCAVHSLQPHTRLLDIGTTVRLRIIADHTLPCFDAKGNGVVTSADPAWPNRPRIPVHRASR